MLINQQIKTFEVELTGLDGEDLGIVKTQDALKLAREAKADLVCDSLMKSPPPCRLVRSGKVRQEQDKSRKLERAAKVKEIRFAAETEEHDLDTKIRQAERILAAGDSVLLTVKVTGKAGAAAKALLEQLVSRLKEAGRSKTGIQLSGKQAQVELESRLRIDGKVEK